MLQALLSDLHKGHDDVVWLVHWALHTDFDALLLEDGAHSAGDAVTELGTTLQTVRDALHDIVTFTEDYRVERG